MTKTRRVILPPFCMCVLVLAGCGVPQRYNEDHAIGAMEAIRQAEMAFKSKNGRYGELQELSASHFGIPSRLQNGYEFRLLVNQESYVASATPIRWRERSLSLYLDQSGVIRGMLKNGNEADDRDPPLNGYGINP